MLLQLCRDHGATVVPADELVGEAAAEEPVTWMPGWECALSRLTDRARGTPTRFEICVADEEHAGDWLDRLAVDLPARGHALTVRAPVPIAIRLEGSPADLRLKTVGPAPLAFVGDEELVVGGNDPTGWTAHITSTAAVAAARRLLLAE